MVQGDQNHKDSAAAWVIAKIAAATPGPESQSQPATQPEPAPQPEHQPEPAPQPEPQPETQTEPHPEVQPEPGPQPEPQPEPQPAAPSGRLMPELHSSEEKGLSLIWGKMTNVDGYDVFVTPCNDNNYKLYISGTGRGETMEIPVRLLLCSMLTERV